jgi:hypothetical protein
MESLNKFKEMFRRIHLISISLIIFTMILAITSSQVWAQSQNNDDFSIDTFASNGGPWSDILSMSIPAPISNHVGLISDQSELVSIISILDEIGLAYDIINNNWDGSQGIYTSNYTFLQNYDVIIWYASGTGVGRLTTIEEHDALEFYLQSGGRLLVTGYDTLGSPTDPLLADLVRSLTSGDGPFVYDYTVTNGSHPIMDGPYGSFPDGTTLTAGHSDHDMAEADAGRNAVTVAELTDGYDKIMATDLDPASLESGRIVYWNGNYDILDWVGNPAITSANETEVKQESLGELSLYNESLLAHAERINLGELPSEANVSDEGTGWRVDSDALEELQNIITESTIMTSASTTFIASGDTIVVANNPWWWHAGDYAEGVRTLSLGAVEHVDYTLIIGTNGLYSTGHVDFDLSINGISIGSFTVLPGEMVKNLSFDFPPIAGPSYTIRLQETNTVDPGMGSISLPVDQSYMYLFNRPPEILKNTLAWLSEGTDAFGDPYEPNDTPAECADIFFGIPITDPTINPPGDYDYYCFEGIATQEIAADIDAQVIGSSLDSVISLFDSDGTTILAQNDDYGSLDSYLEYVLPHEGLYYIRVRSFGHPCCGGPNYTYTLLLTDITQPRSLPFFDDMESGQNGWGADGFWHQVQDGVSPYPNSYSPTHSWWYGQDSTGDYNNGAANSGNLTSPPIVIPPGLSTGLNFRTWYETEPLLLPQDIYFDVYHDTDGNDNISGGIYTNWANYMVGLGCSVTEFNQPIDPVTLSGFQVLAVFDPEIPFSSTEIDAINYFMAAGGRVVALGEYYDFQGTNTILNALTAGKGIILNNDVVSDPTNNDSNPQWPIIYNFTGEPVLPLNYYVSQAVLYAGASLSLSGPAIPLATGDADTSLSSSTTTSSNDIDENGIPAAPYMELQAIIPGAPVVMAYAPVGDGSLIVLGDSGLWTNEDPDVDGIISLEEYSNQALSKVLFQRLVDSPVWDQKWLQISADDGPFQNLLQITGGPMGTWYPIEIELSPYAGTTVRLRFHFDTIDSAVNNYRGWYIDDVLLDLYLPNDLFLPLVLK